MKQLNIFKNQYLLNRSKLIYIPKSIYNNQFQTFSTNSALKKEVVFSTYQANPINVYNREIDHFSSTTTKWAAQQIFQLCEKIKQNKIKPDLTTYYGLLSASRNLKDIELASKYYEELKSMGLKPDSNCINILLSIQSPHIGQFTSMVFELAKRDEIELNSTSYDLAIKNYLKAGAYEMALNLFDQIKGNDQLLVPSIYATLIQISFQIKDPELVTKFSKLAFHTKNRFNHPDLFILLRGYLEMDMPDFTYQTWDHLVEVQRLLPDQGLVELVLSAAARWGNAQLATSVLRVLSELKIPCEDYHFIPLIEAFLKSKQWDKGIQILNLAAQTKIEPPQTAFVYFRRQLRSQPNDLVEATRYIMDKQRSGSTLPSSFIYMVMESNLLTKEIESGLELFEIAKKQNTSLDILYYNAVIQALATNNQVERCKRFYTKMQTDGIKPNETTYSHLIHLACSQTSYEDAFILLEEMKSSDIIPSKDCYGVIIRKCAVEKDERVYMAMEEMDMFGYPIPDQLRQFVESQFKEE